MAEVILPRQMDRIPQALGAWLARRRAWNPIGRRVQLAIDESGDPALFGKKITATIRATALDENGELSHALLELDHAIDYAGHYIRRGLRTVLTRPYLRWHDLNRLLVSSAAVRVIDAEDFNSDAYERIIALASMRIMKE
jgi:hypothetical protein